MVLPTLLILAVILLVMTSALLALGTQSLRVTTHDQQSDTACFAAEAGLAEAAEAYVQDGSLPSVYEGQMPTGATYSVTKYENSSDTFMDVPGGPSIPPSTVYLLSEGESVNGTKRRAGALFKTGLGAFKAGIVTSNLTAEGSTFRSYDSSVDVSPANSQVSDTGLMASNKSDFSDTSPQFSLTDSTVEGGVFVAPGTDPVNEILKTGSTTTARDGALSDAIVLEDVEVPDLPAGEATGGTTTGGSGVEGNPSSTFGATELVISWDALNNQVRFYDTGGGVTLGTVPIDTFQQYWSEGDDVNLVTFTFPSPHTVDLVFSGGAPMIKFHDGAVNAGAQQDLTAAVPAWLSTAGGGGAVSTEDADSLAGGKYKEVSIGSGVTTELGGGTYVIEDLVISDGGSLSLPDGEATIYVTGGLSAEGENAMINTTKIPPNLKIYYTGTDKVTLSGGAESYLTLVAQDAEVELVNNSGAPQTTFYGALVGQSVTVSNAEFYFDTSTEGVGTGTDGSVLTLINRQRL